MHRNMNDWIAQLYSSQRKPALPMLSFPAIQLMGISVRELISNSKAQATGMKQIADRVDAAASVSLMDLSVEAECFGSKIRITDDEVPTVIGSLIHSPDEAAMLSIPPVGSGRTGIYLQAIQLAIHLITDRPVLAGVIGPFSLAGRLMGVTDTMIHCYEEPKMVHKLVYKATQFLKSYCQAYKKIGANGVILAEPLAGLLSSALAEEFSNPYVKEIVDTVQTDTFTVIYHNCGNSTIHMINSILSIGANAYHFGNAINMAEMMARIPPNIIAMGNVDPAAEFHNGTPESIRKATMAVMHDCCKYPNFVISSGCDIPPMSPWTNIDAFFYAVNEFYDETGNN